MQPHALRAAAQAERESRLCASADHPGVNVGIFLSGRGAGDEVQGREFERNFGESRLT